MTLLVLTAPTQNEDVLGALVAGASGYLLKDEAVEDIVTGVVREIHWRGGQARFGGIGPDGRPGGPGPVAET